MTVLDHGMGRLQLEVDSSGDEIPLEHFKKYLTSSEPQVPYREAAEALGVSEGAVATAVHRLRKRYGRCLRAEIAETVVDSGQVDDELRHLLAVLRP